jgi:hypothetical protein
MTREQLSARAREELKHFESQAVGIQAETFVEIKALDAVMFYFECQEHGDTVEVFLQKDSGEFMQLTHTPGKPTGKAN